eukprot:gene2922-5736_t
MSNRSILSRWQTEYFAPVVVTLATADVERICLENGLLFHELLSAFGHLDTVNASIRTSGQIFPVAEANIRFERISEVVQKNSGVVEELLREHFEEFDINRIPSNIFDLKASPPSAWTQKLEQLVMHSVSFSEFEMASHPLILLTVVSTTDEDPVACMRELASIHHMPPCFFTGQYDSEIHRVYLLVHDKSSTRNVDINKLLLKMQSAMAPAAVRLLPLNSLPSSTPNLQQPDLWTQTTHPLFFPQHAPYLNTSIYEIALDPNTQKPIKGSRLSLEDFISLRTFCMELYLQDIVPAMEKRLQYLSKQVNENRKGVKNVLKSFWRKPREEGQMSVKGQAKYRFDRSEAQVLLLADASFAVKDYETAAAMYRLAREDFRSDKSVTHLAHTTVMLAVCQLAGEPNACYLGNSTTALAAAALRSAGHHREICGHLEVLSQCIMGTMEPSYPAAIYAILAAELHTSPVLIPAIRSPLESAHILLQAAAGLTKLPLLCALLTERAAWYYMQAGHMRRYAFQEVLAGHKFHTCGNKAQKHAIVCFANAMAVHDTGKWSSIKVKLNRALADEFKNLNENPEKTLVLLLRILTTGARSNNFIHSSDQELIGKSTIPDILAVLKEISSEGPWGFIRVLDGWQKRNIRQTLLGEGGTEEEVIIAPYSTVKLLLQATPICTGKYRVVAVKWRIGSVFIRQSLQKDGILLQKTLVQRAERQRCEDLSLQFEVCAQHALLRLDFDTFPNDVLQGEISYVQLTICNEGHAVANAITLKFNQACCLVHVIIDGTSDTLPWWGQSGTIIPLSEDVIIPPGESLSLGLWLRLDTVGKQRVAVLASYGSIRSAVAEADIETDDSTAATAPVRTSSTAISMQVFPSIGISLKCLLRPNHPFLRTLILDISNKLIIDDDTDDDYEGTIPPSTNRSHVSDIADNVLHVDGIRVLGGALVANSSKEIHCHNNNSSSPNAIIKKSIDVKPYERLTLCIPLELTDTTMTTSTSTSIGAVEKRVGVVGSLPVCVSWYSKPQQLSNLTPIIEQLACLSYISQRLHAELNEIRNRRKFTITMSVPRSIQSVRRENIKSSSSSSSLASTATTAASTSTISMDKTTNMNNATTTTAKAGPGPGPGSGNGSGIPSVSSTGLHLPEVSMQGLASVQAQDNAIALSVGWECKWKGRIRRGVHFIYGVSMLPISAGLNSSSSNSNGNGNGQLQSVPRIVAADFLSVSLMHPTKTILQQYNNQNINNNNSKILTSHTTLVAVELELRSIGKYPLVVWADALDWERNPDQDGNSLRKNYITPEDLLGTNSTQSCRWLGKVRYEAVRIVPFGKVCLPFVATFNRNGIYDLKNFRITVDFADDTMSTPSVKHIHGQSLIEITN